MRCSSYVFKKKKKKKFKRENQTNYSSYHQLTLLRIPLPTKICKCH